MFVVKLLHASLNYLAFMKWVDRDRVKTHIEDAM